MDVVLELVVVGNRQCGNGWHGTKVGSVTLGSVTGGNVTLGSVTLGSVGRVRPGSDGAGMHGIVTLGNVTLGNVTGGNVTLGKVTLGNVTLGNVTFGNVTLGNVTGGNVTFGSVTFGNVGSVGRFPTTFGLTLPERLAPMVVYVEGGAVEGGGQKVFAFAAGWPLNESPGAMMNAAAATPRVTRTGFMKRRIIARLPPETGEPRYCGERLATPRLLAWIGCHTPVTHSAVGDCGSRRLQSPGSKN